MCCSVQYFGASITHTHICVISWHKIVLFVACAAKYSSIFWCKRRTCTHCVISRHKIVLFDACAAKCSSIFWCKLFLYTFLWDFVTKNNHIRRSRRKIWLFLVTKSHKSVYRQHNIWVISRFFSEKFAAHLTFLGCGAAFCLVIFWDSWQRNRWTRVRQYGDEPNPQFWGIWIFFVYFFLQFHSPSGPK